LPNVTGRQHIGLLLDFSNCVTNTY